MILELLPEYRNDPAALDLLYVRSSHGELVPLGAVRHAARGRRSVVDQPPGQLPVGDALVQPRSRASRWATPSTRSQRLARTELPATITTSFQGTAQAFQSSLKGLGILLSLAILVIYLVLGILYESFIHPLTILSALPFAGLRRAR